MKQRMRMRRRGMILLSLLLLAGLGALSSGLLSPAQEIGSKKAGTIRTDAYGDPLPEGAIARFGTLRFRSSSSLPRVHFADDGKSLLTAMVPTPDICIQGRSWKSFWSPDPPKTECQRCEVPSGKELTHYSIPGVLLGISTARNEKDPTFLYGSEVSEKILKSGVIIAFKKVYIRQSGKDKLLKTCALDETRVRAAAISPNGERVAIVGLDNVIRVLDTATGAETHALREHASDVLTMDFDQTGNWLATADDRTVRVCDLVSRKPLLIASFKQSPQTQTATNLKNPRVALSPDGRWLAIRNGYAVDLWNVATAKKRHTLSGLFPKDVYAYAVIGALTFTPDSRKLVIGDMEAVRLVDMATGKALQRYEGQHYDPVHSLGISPDGRTLATEADGYVRLWDVATGRIIPTPPTNVGTVFTLAFSRDGKLLATGDSPNPIIRIWDVATQKQVHRINVLDAFENPEEKRGATYWRGAVSRSLDFSPDGKLLLVTTWGGYLWLYDVSNGRPVRKLSRGESTNDATTGTFIRNGKVIAAICGASHDVHLWDVVSGEELEPLKAKLPPPPHKGGKDKPVEDIEAPTDYAFCLLAACPERDCLAAVADCSSTYSEDPNYHPMVLWERGVEQSPLIGAGIKRASQGDVAELHRMVFNSDGTLLLVSNASQVELLEAATLKSLYVLAKPESAYCAPALSPNGHIIATYGRDYIRAEDQYRWTLRFSEVWTGTSITTMPLKEGALNLAFTPDGKHLAAGISTFLLLEVPRAGGTQEQMTRLAKNTLAKLWQELRNKEADQAYPAMAAMADRPEETVAFLRKQLQPRPHRVTREQIAQWIADLDAASYPRRAAAIKALLAVGCEADLPLRAALQSKKLTLEASLRVKETLRKLPKMSLARPFPVPPDQLQRLRAIQVLEWIGSIQAREVLDTLCRGGPDAHETQEANGALKRLRRRLQMP